MVDNYQVWKRVTISWVHTLAVLIFMFLAYSLLIYLSIRFGGFKVVYRIVGVSTILTIVVFLLSEPIVNMLLGAERADKKEHRLFYSLTKSVCKKSALIYQPMPRLYIMTKVKEPNAMAYGIGIFGQYAIGITQSLFDRLTLYELEAVIAHELAHIRCKDVGLMSVLVILHRGGKWLSYAMLSGALGPVGFLIGIAVLAFVSLFFPIGTSAISQQREFSADALGAKYIGNPNPLKSALERISSKSINHETIFSELFISHPEMGNRLESLNRLRRDHSKSIKV